MRSFILSILFVLSFLSVALATPPASIQLSYDLKKNILHVEAEHVSSRLERHYLRIMKIIVNQKEVKTLYYPRQRMPKGFEEDIPLQVQEGDTIKVFLFCSQGGMKEEELVVPKVEKKEEVKL